MTKKELVLEVIDRLKKEYPDADCTLDYDNAWPIAFKPIIMEFSTQNSTFFRIYPKLVCIQSAYNFYFPADNRHLPGTQFELSGTCSNLVGIYF